jgi:uncharacterized protein (DUF849 family)
MEIASRKVIITCAVTGNAPFNPKHPSFPVSPGDIAASAIEAANAGASIVHIHVRDIQTGKGSRDPKLFKEVVDRIRDAGSEVLINLTGGLGAFFLPDPADERRPLPQSDVASVDERMEHFELCRPDLASLDVTTGNQIEGNLEFVYLNTTRTLREMAARLLALQIKPELEIFGPGDILFAKQLIAEGLIKGIPMFQFVLGVKWAAPTSTSTIIYLRGLLPEPAVWGALGIGKYEMPVVAQTALLGGNVRVGLEDNLYLSRGEYATNRQLVERARNILEYLGYEIASVPETRKILGIPI